MEQRKAPHKNSRYESVISEDHDIMERMRLGDQGAIIDVKRKYGRLYWAIMDGILHNSEDVSECENDLLYSLWNKICSAKPEELPQNLKVYIERAARNTAIDLYRKQRRRIRAEVLDECLDASSPDNVVDEIASEEMKRSVVSFVKGLSREDRILFTLRFIRCMNTDQIANQLGVKYSTAASRLSRLRRKLKNHLIMEGFLDESENNKNEK